MSDVVDHNGNSAPPDSQSSNKKEALNSYLGGISAPNSGNNPVVTPSKAAIQMQKMRDVNTKYKNILKMAKECIEQQEIELKEIKRFIYQIFLLNCLIWFCNIVCRWIMFKSDELSLIFSHLYSIF
jgi:hypothetical protein